MKLRFSRREQILIVLMLVLLLLLFLFLRFFPTLSSGMEPVKAGLWNDSITRLIVAAIFLLLVLYMDFPLLSFKRIPGGRALLLSLPALLIAVNNFPLIGLFCGYVRVERTELIPLLLLSCLATGLFEEVAFRGAVFPLLLRYALRYTAKKGLAFRRISSEVQAVFLAIVGSSAVFAVMHLSNLLVGGSPLAVLLQIGYSFLIGGMCSIVLLLSRNLFIPAVIHSVYNFGGYLIPTLGSGNLWDTPTVILTVVVSLAVLVYFLLVLFSLPGKTIRALLRDEPSDSHVSPMQP